MSLTYALSYRDRVLRRARRHSEAAEVLGELLPDLHSAQHRLVIDVVLLAPLLRVALQRHELVHDCERALEWSYDHITRFIQQMK